MNKRKDATGEKNKTSIGNGRKGGMKLEKKHASKFAFVGK